MARFDLTDEEWAIIKPPLPPQVRGPERKDDRKFSTAFSTFCEPVRLGVICRIGMVREPRSTTATAVGASEGFGETCLRLWAQECEDALIEPPRVYRRLFCSKPMRPCQGRSCLHGRRPPFPAAVRWPMAPCSRPVLYQITHCRVSHSTRATDFHGPKNPMTPVLNRPITLSARALSQLSPTLPAEMSIPASARHSV